MIRTALILPLILAACAPSGLHPPSLLPRAAEKMRIDDPPANTVVPTATAASVDTQAAVSRLLAQADEGEATQLKVLAANRGALAGRNASAGSEAYVTAQVALSALETARLPTLDALAELDRLGATAENNVDVAAFAAAQTKVQSMIERQDARLR